MKKHNVILIVLLIALSADCFSQNVFTTKKPEAPTSKPTFNNGTYFYAVRGTPLMNRFNIKSTNPVKVTVSNLPAGVIFNSVRNLIQGSVATAGIYKYKVKATNSDGSDSLTITLDVRDSLNSAIPPMGWMTWDIFGCNYNETILKQIADAMVSSGMKNAGYKYLVIDDCWTGKRDANGLIQPDATKFPSGMKILADYVHSKGLKLGIYSDAATSTCGGYIGSYGNEQKDVNQFASWGIDFVKYDYCGAPSTVTDATNRYTAMRKAMNNTKRPMIFNVCEWGQLTPWSWSSKLEGNMWRVSFDTRDNWDAGQYDNAHNGVIQLLNIMPGLEYYSGPNAWNDPDMLATGSSNMNLIEEQSQFSLFCLFSSPLTTSFDIRSINQNTKNILLNSEAIDIDQDALGQQASRVKTGTNYEIYVKDLADGSKAVGLLNLSGTQTVSITANWSDLYISGMQTIRDVWKKQNMGASAVSYTASVKPHEIILLRIAPSTVSVPEELTFITNLNAYIANDRVFYSYNVNQTQFVKVELVGVDGARIAIIENSNQYTGDHRGEMDCQNLKPGIYILRIISENGAQARKLIKH
jgi:alpha-galactosidase